MVEVGECRVVIRLKRRVFCVEKTFIIPFFSTLIHTQPRQRIESIHISKAPITRMNQQPTHMHPATCPLCNAEAAWTALHQTRDFYHCRFCDLIFVPPNQHPDLKSERARYASHNNTMDNAGYVTMFEGPIALLGEHCEDGNRILDYGCGPGPVLVELLRRAGYDAVGYDPFFAPNVDLSCSFDAIISTETFEHFACPRAEINRILRLLRHGGILAVMTLFHPGPAAVADWWYARDPTHVAFYSHATLDWICGEFHLTTLHRDDKNFTILRCRS